MTYLPDTDNALVIRTDFSDDAAWDLVCRAIQQPVDIFQANVDCVSDPAYDGLTVDQLPALIRPDSFRSFLFIVDRMTIFDPEYPVLVVDLYTELGRTFRAVPSEIGGIENNLSIANMDFAEFADAVDPDGVFRGFPES